jgi:hypothetical protein
MIGDESTGGHNADDGEGEDDDDARGQNSIDGPSASRYLHAPYSWSAQTVLLLGIQANYTR